MQHVTDYVNYCINWNSNAPVTEAGGKAEPSTSTMSQTESLFLELS